jgi:hypothetical protein
MEATRRDPERPAQPIRRPDPPGLRDESELHARPGAYLLTGRYMCIVRVDI